MVMFTGPYGQATHQFHRLSFLFVSLTGVYFTKYCRDLCVQLGIGGWVKNSKTGTIVGKIQGERTKVEEV
jgi:acylphosphatase